RRRPAVAALLAVLAVVLTGAFFGLTALWLQAEAALESARLAKKDADEQKQAALEAEARATKEKNIAVEAEAKVKQSYLDLRHQTYIAGMDLAQRALKEGYQKQARTLLDQLKIHAPGEPDLRGFEWFYLYRLSDTRQNSIAAHIERITQLALSS